MLVRLPREQDYSLTPRTKNSPALAGCGAITITNVPKKAAGGLPAWSVN